MTRVVRLKPAAEVDAEAAAWTWRLDAGTLSATDRAQFESWMHEDPRHRRAFEEFGATWRALDRLSEFKREEKIATLARATRHAKLRWSTSGWWAAAAASALLLIGGGWWLGRPTGVRVQQFSTAVGQENTVTLTDGSVIALNTDTRIVVRFTRGRRDIDLLKGEAHFHDTYDPARPFFVHAGDAQVQAIGTQFEVRLHADRRIDVLVNQGLVEVRAGGRGLGAFNPFDRSSRPARVQALHAGQQLSIAGAHVEIESVSSRQISDDLAWRQGALVFDNEPLSQAVAEVGRYTRAHIILTPDVRQLRISGRFMTSDVPGFFKALETALPVRVTRSGPDLITVDRR